ncbi:hypothetical protein LTR95_009668 [Oleoguttula sp. CCFEE 5521]
MATIAACPLYALPAKIHDTVLAYAFPHDPLLKVIYANEWNTWQKQKQSLSSQRAMRPFPAPKVDDWLVWKRFVCDAAQTWFAARTFPTLMRYAWNPKPELLPPCLRISRCDAPTTFCGTTSAFMINRHTRLFYAFSVFADVPSAMIQGCSYADLSNASGSSSGQKTSSSLMADDVDGRIA